MEEIINAPIAWIEVLANDPVLLNALVVFNILLIVVFVLLNVWMFR